jgi:hypothetical protein
MHQSHSLPVGHRLPDGHNFHVIEHAFRGVDSYLNFGIDWNDPTVQQEMVELFDEVRESFVCYFDEDANYMTDEDAPAPGDEDYFPKVYFGFTHLSHLRFVNYECFQVLLTRQKQISQGTSFRDLSRNQFLADCISLVARADSNIN